MSRFLLDSQTLARISRKVPELGYATIVLGLRPDFVSMRFQPGSSIPVATVCLRDAATTLQEAMYALSELFAHRIWYQEKREPPDEEAAAGFCRFYADDTALRLYSAAEHLANGIAYMLNISGRALEKYREKRSSQQSIVGSFLKREKPDHPITQAVLRLAKAEDWQTTIAYRNKWVHEQPPLVDGLGVVYKRQDRWRTQDSGKSWRLGIGVGGDAPEYSVDELLGFIRPALLLFRDTLTTVIRYYIELLEKRGITVSTDWSQVSVKLL